MPLVGFAASPSSRWSSSPFLWLLGPLAVHHVSWIWNSNFVFLLSMYSSRGRLRNQVVSTSVWLWWVIDLTWFEFESRIFRLFYPIICLCGESCLLVSWCVGDKCDMADSDEDRGSCRRPGADDRWWSSTGQVPGGQTIERSGDAMCGLHGAHVDEEHEFLGWASKPWSMDFLAWAWKSTIAVWWFGPQNEVADSLSVAPRNWWEEDDTGDALISSGLLYLEASQARVSQFASKLAEEWWWEVHVASSRRSREDEAEDGQVNAMDCIRLFYPKFVIFVVLGPRGSFVISFPINRTLRVGGEVSIQLSLSHPLAIVAFWEVWMCFVV
jgi:hypothetical protein